VSSFVIAFLRKKITYLKKKIIFKSFTSICYSFLKKSEFKINIKTTSNEKLLRAASQKIDFFRGERKWLKRLN